MAFLLVLSLSFAESLVAINSVDGRDVLSGIFYANAKGLPVKFMPVPGGNSDIFASKVGSGNDILLIQSAANPVSGFVETELKNKGNTVEVFPSSDGGETNLALARKSGAEKFIIVDSAYSDSAMSVIPYAAATKSYVILADRTNIDQVKAIVAGKGVTVYGSVSKEVKAALADSSPSYIGKGEDKYEDNVELVGKMMAEFSMDRPIFTDGTLLEDSIAEGKSPIILTGRLVPAVTYEFIKQQVRDGKMPGILLIGNGLIYPAYDMRERLKNDLAKEGVAQPFGVMVKFGQAIPSAQTGIMNLDTFSVPAYKPQLGITEIFYNQQTRKLMVGLENIGDGPLYYAIEVKVLVDGKDFRSFGASEVKLVDRGESSGLEYPLDISSVSEGAITTAVVVKYGAYMKSLEEFATSDSKLTTITYTDNSNVSVKFAKYDREGQRIQVSIKNGGDSVAYVFAKITLIDESGVPTKISAAGIRQIDPGSIFTEEFPLILSAKEEELNKEVTVSVDYGGRRGFLGKQAVYTVPLEQAGAAAAGIDLGPIVLGALAAGVLLVVLLIVLFVGYKLFAGRKGKPQRKRRGG